jgi:hypothetical protein
MDTYEYESIKNFKKRDGEYVTIKYPRGYLTMINDVVRNRFYDKILTEVKDQHCVEIGFGTGLLSLLALKHGALSIVAYESDPDAYIFGSEIIKKLKLQDRITLINEHYDYTFEHDQTIVFTETVDSNIWGEGLYNSLPRHLGKKFLPGQYFLEIYAIPISTDIACNLIQSHETFYPGVDINPRFVLYINYLLSKKYHKSIKGTTLPKGVTEMIPYKPIFANWIDDKIYADKYVVDANMSFLDCPVRELHVSTSEQPMLIVPRAGIQHNNERMYLDVGGSWGLPSTSAVINSPNSVVTIQHDLLSGKISYMI